jgi:hypothetical protein
MIIEQDVELDQLRQVVGQLQAEKEEVLGRAEKLAEDLEGELFVVEVVVEKLFPSNDSLNTIKEPGDSSTC